MAVGIWIKDNAGNLLLGPETQTIIATGSIQTGTVNGSVVDARLNGGYPTIISVLPINGAAPLPPDLFFTPSENRLSWTFPSGGGVNHRIIYGIYC